MKPCQTSPVFTCSLFTPLYLFPPLSRLDLINLNLDVFVSLCVRLEAPNHWFLHYIQGLVPSGKGLKRRGKLSVLSIVQKWGNVQRHTSSTLPTHSRQRMSSPRTVSPNSLGIPHFQEFTLLLMYFSDVLFFEKLNLDISLASLFNVFVFETG